MRLEEEALRRGTVDRVATRVTEGGEIDIYRAPEVPGVEIRIILTRDGHDEVSCSSRHPSTDEGRPIESINVTDSWPTASSSSIAKRRRSASGASRGALATGAHCLLREVNWRETTLGSVFPIPLEAPSAPGAAGYLPAALALRKRKYSR
ncbi:hypothetical protein ACW9UR_23920 [Halovulum sp. GXIMD14794]